MITNEIYFFKNQSSVSTSDSLYNVNDGTLILQVDGNVSNLELLVLGNTDLIDDDFVTLKTINASDYSMDDKITSTGIYWIDINGIRKIKLNLSKITGSVNVKALTKRGLTTDLVARAMAANASGGSSYTLPVASADTLGGIKIGENLSIDENGVVSASGIKGLYTIGILNLGGRSPFNLTDEEKIQFNNIITDASSKNHSSVGIFAYADSGDMQPSKIPNYMHCCLLYTVSSIKNTSTSFKFAGCYPTFGSIAQVKMLDITISGSWSNGVFTGTSYMCTWSDANLVTKTDVLVKKNTSPYTPTSDYNPATKKYVDDTITTAITTSLEGSY